MVTDVSRADVIAGTKPEAPSDALNKFAEAATIRFRVNVLKQYIIEWATRTPEVNMDEIYASDIEPYDGDMYDAFSELVRDGILEGPDPYNKTEQATRRRHQDYVYRCKERA